MKRPWKTQKYPKTIYQNNRAAGSIFQPHRPEDVVPVAGAPEADDDGPDVALFGVGHVHPVDLREGHVPRDLEVLPEHLLHASLDHVAAELGLALHLYVMLSVHLGGSAEFYTRNEVSCLTDPSP